MVFFTDIELKNTLRELAGVTEDPAVEVYFFEGGNDEKKLPKEKGSLRKVNANEHCT